ncbi:hypothetical protein E1B28_009989 [Marasmius oreades]|uniref:Uncharacterized protein n=1 Tax=Marasmius oreades TaxID=181124 RepID=A0A9P7RXN3_9AGAR|nr:uncharacterized protein E1B28_009989 [Marasmius oreades]KAG7090913.1 hypothetical protein E1B28_009989 [Marasmius oreades]
MFSQLFFVSFLFFSVQAKSRSYYNQQCYDEHDQLIPCQWTKAEVITAVVILVLLLSFLLFLCCSCCRCRSSRRSKTTSSTATSNSISIPKIPNYSRDYHVDVESGLSSYDAALNERSAVEKKQTWTSWNTSLSKNAIAAPEPTHPSSYSRC